MSITAIRPASDPMLSVRGLTVSFDHRGGELPAIRDLDLDLAPREVVGLVGESGSGKSVAMRAIMGLLRGAGASVGGEAWFEGQNLLQLDERRLRHVRGLGVSMIFQDPMTAFNPVITVGAQLVEAVRVHDRRLSRAAARRRALDLFQVVGIADVATRLRQYPHEFSGGMRQRAMIAMAIANNPRVLIADEPTTALDVTIQAQILDLLRRIRDEYGVSIIFITHDLGLLADFADRVLVMYAGRIVEDARTATLLNAPRHPYAQGLVESLPASTPIGNDLIAIPGSPPDLSRLPGGCAFHPRCVLRNGRQRCLSEVPELRTVGAEHRSACHFAEEL